MSSTGHVLPEKALVRAFNAMRDFVRDTEAPVQWRQERISDLGALQALAEEFHDSVRRERDLLEQGGELYKDHPPANSIRVARPLGFVDDSHAAEAQISVRMDGLLKKMQVAHLADMQRKKAVSLLRLVGEAMDDCGMCLSQKKGFAAKNTMPLDPDEKFRLRFSAGFFTKMNLARGDGKKR